MPQEHNPPQPFEKSVDLKSYTPGIPGYSTGNNAVDTLLSTLLSLIGGTHISPRAVPGRSIYEGYLQRERSRDFMRIAQSGFGDLPTMQMFGPMDKNSNTYAILSRLLGQPDSPLLRMMSPFNGGNPIAAQMQLYAGLNGMTMDTFGTRGNLNVPESSRMMRVMYDTLYEKRHMTDADLSDVQSRYARNISNMLAANSSAGRLLGTQSLNDSTDLGVTFTRYSDAISGRLKAIDNAIIEEAKKGNQSTIDALKKEQRELHQASHEVAKARAAIGDISKLVDEGYAIPTGTNFGKTRGFEVEDLTRGFVSSAQLKLLSGRGRGVVGTFGDFLKNGVEVMDAARSTFGLSNGSEIMDALNQFVGTGAVDMSNEASANKLSDLLRRVKGAARTAGISVDAILGIIKEGQLLASSHPQLQYIGGMAVAEVSLKALAATSAMASTVGNDFVRRHGGEAGLTQTIQQSYLQEIQEPVAQTAMAANYQLEQMKRGASSDMLRKIEAAQRQLAAAANNPAYATKNNFANLLIGIGNNLGINGIGFLQQSRNSLIQKQAGMMEGNAELGQQFSRNALMTQLRMLVPDGALEDIANYMEENQVSFAQAIANPRFAAFAPAVSQVYNHNPMAVEQGMLGMIGSYRDALAIRQRRTAQYATAERSAAEKLAHLQTPLFQNLAQAFMKGELSQHGLDSIRNMIADGPEQLAASTILNALKDLSDDKTSGNAARLLTALNPEQSGILGNVNNVENFNSVIGKIGLEDLLRYAGDQDAFALAKSRNSALEKIGFSDVQRAAAFAQAAGFYTADGKSLHGNRKFAGDEIYGLYGEQGMLAAINKARAATLAPLEQQISDAFLEGNDKAIANSGRFKPGTAGYDAFWGAQAEIDQRYIKWDGNKRVGFNVAQYQADLAAGTVSDAVQQRVGVYMGEYETIAKGFDEAQAKISTDLKQDSGQVLKTLSETMSIFSRDLPGIITALNSIQTTLAEVAK